jgi:hypothetical protein
MSKSIVISERAEKHQHGTRFSSTVKQGSPASAINNVLLHWAPPRLRLSYGQASVGPAGRQVGGAIIHRWSWGFLVSQYIKNGLGV